MYELLRAVKLLDALSLLHKSYEGHVAGKNSLQPSSPHSIYYRRRVSSIPTPNYGDRFGQTWEPAGEYMAPVDGPVNPEDLAPDGEVRGATGRKWFEHGVVHFQNPVVIHRPKHDHIGWKKMLSEHLGGKTGKALSQELQRRGHDGVVVKDPTGRPDEVVNLSGRKEVIHPFPPEAQRFLGPRRRKRV